MTADDDPGDGRDVLEKSILGGVLIDPQVLTLLPALETGDFANLKCRAVWAAIRNLETASRPIDTTTIAGELEREDRFDAIGGYAFLGELALIVPVAARVVEYAASLRDLALISRVKSTLRIIAEESRQARSGADLLSVCWAELSKLTSDVPDATRSIGDLVKARVRDLERIAEERAKGGSAMTGFPTGVAALDEKIGGWQPGIAQIVAARPAMGKSSLALATADAASKAGYGVHAFSLEDSWHAIADRTIARDSRVAATKLRAAELTRDDMRSVGATINMMARRQGWLVDERSGITADEIVRSVRRHAKTNRTRVVIVDYVQIVRARPSKREKDENAVLSEVIDTLADAAAQDHMAYVVLSQLNRDVEKRQDRRPMMSDLRGSGALEQRVKIAVGLYRGAYYGPTPIKGIDYDCNCARGAYCDHIPTPDEFERTIQLVVMKNNNGPTGVVRARWDGPTTRME